MNVVVVATPPPLAAGLCRSLAQRQAVRSCRELAPDEEPGPDDVLVYVPAAIGFGGYVPDVETAGAVFQRCARAGLRQAVIVSSAAACAPDHRNQGHVSEKHVGRKNHPVGGEWLRFEASAREHLGREGVRLTILRPCALASNGAFGRLFTRRLVFPIPGHDPSIQLLHRDDLWRAVGLAVERAPGGVLHVAPRGVVPLRKALRRSSRLRLPLPLWLQRLDRRLRAPGQAAPAAQLDYMRYSWTVSGERAHRALAFEPEYSSMQALFGVDSTDGAVDEHDPYGMDPHYIDAHRRGLLRFLHDAYWRVEVSGLEHVPSAGRAVLVGVHRGFMPFDATMLLYAVAGRWGRYVRFLIHPSLVKFPFLCNFITKLGGVMTSGRNADWVLGNEELLGVYPEGIRGAFTMYRDAYRLGRFGRDEYVRMALRNSAPIIPFVTVGSAEIFPILGRIDWRWWKRLSEWPFLPVTPTFPLLPLPLPSKWHTLVLPPLAVGELYPPEAADDPEVVRAVGQDVRQRMQKALTGLLEKRRAIFYGRVFHGDD